MQQVPIESKTIASIAYNEETSALHVWMRRGRHLIHYNITKAMFENLASAEEPDFYYKTYIVD